MDSTHVVTLQLPGISKDARKINIFLVMKTSPLIFFEVLCDDGCTIIQYKQDIMVHKNGQQVLSVHWNKYTRMWEVPQLTYQIKAQTIAIVHNIISQTTKPERAKYYHAALFIPTNTSLIKSTKQGFLKTCPGLTGGLIKKHLYKSMNTNIFHLHMKIQGVHSTRKIT